MFVIQPLCYRRNFTKGGTYFFTVNLKNRQSTVLTDSIDLLRESFAFVQRQKPYTIIAIVILPKHLHCIWQLPENDKDYPARWKAIKSRFTRTLKKEAENCYKIKHGEYNIWQRRYWEHTIRDRDDLTQHINYIHYNPVKHGWVNSVADWPFSFFHTFVKHEQLAANWGQEINSTEITGYGERNTDS